MQNRNTANSLQENKFVQTNSKKLSIKTPQYRTTSSQTVPVVTIDLASTNAQKSTVWLDSIVTNIALSEKALEKAAITSYQRMLPRSQRVASNQGNVLADNGNQTKIHSAPQFTAKHSFLCGAEEGCHGVDAKPDEFYAAVPRVKYVGFSMPTSPGYSSFKLSTSSLLKFLPVPQSSLVVASENIEDDKDGCRQKPYDSLQNAMFVSENIEDDKDGCRQKPYDSLQNAMLSKNVEGRTKTNAKDTSTKSYFSCFTNLLPACTMFSSCTQPEVDKNEMKLTSTVVNDGQRIR